MNGITWAPHTFENPPNAPETERPLPPSCAHPLELTSVSKWKVRTEDPLFGQFTLVFRDRVRAQQGPRVLSGQLSGACVLDTIEQLLTLRLKALSYIEDSTSQPVHAASGRARRQPLAGPLPTIVTFVIRCPSISLKRPIESLGPLATFPGRDAVPCGRAHSAKEGAGGSRRLP